jgi:hypothetical protein
MQVHVGVGETLNRIRAVGSVRPAWVEGGHFNPPGASEQALKVWQHIVLGQESLLIRIARVQIAM